MINQQAAAHIASRPDKHYERMRELSELTGVPVPLMRVDIVSTDADGNEASHYRGWSRTYVRNFYNWLFGAVSSLAASQVSTTNYNDGFVAHKTTAAAFVTTYFPGGSSLQSSQASYLVHGSGSATSGVVINGIVIGTGLVPESFNSFSLATQLLNGASSGLMSYNTQNNPALTWNQSLRQFTAAIVRIFNNNSGASITVTETGLYSGDTSASPIMLWRDLLASPVAVANGGQLTVTYTLVLQYPADVVDNPPFLGNALIDPMVMQQKVSRNWIEESGPRGSPRDWRSTEAWQRQQMRNFKQ